MTVTTTPQQQIIDACEANYTAHIGDCSGFAHAVASALGLTLHSGMANDMVDEIQAAPLDSRWPTASPPRPRPTPATS